MTFREIEQVVLESWLVLFVVDNFRLHRFLHKEHNEKLIFWCVSVTDMNSSKKAIVFEVFLQLLTMRRYNLRDAITLGTHLDSLFPNMECA